MLALLEENNKILKELRALMFLQIYDSDYIEQQDMKAFCINVAADIFVELINENKEFKNKIKDSFLK